MCCALTCCSAIASSAHRALIIGLGEQLDARWPKINGDNDVRYVVNLLQRMGYYDIRTLKNQQATKRGIVDAFNRLINDSSRGDIVYIHYSGHGQLISDLDGDELLRWNTNHAYWDESLIPYDAFMTYGPEDHGEKHLTDDELAVLLNRLRNKIGKNGEIIMVIDACHSGDATCGDDSEVVRGIDTKFNIPRTGNTPSANPIDEQWLTISACQPYQLCTEIKDKRVGKLTYALFNLGADFFKQNNPAMVAALCDFFSKYTSRVAQTPMITGQKR